MSAPLKLAIFGVVIIAVFAIAYVAGSALIPSDFVDSWTHRGTGH